MTTIAQRFENYFGFKTPLIWKNILIMTIFHILSVYALIVYIPKARFITLIFTYIVHLLGGAGVTVGVHRLWCHKAYKAKLPMRIILVIWYSLSGLYSMKQFVRDHRTHHKYTDTDADPHNANRGFFFSHLGWFLMKRHPAVIEGGKVIDLSDVSADPVIQFEEKYYLQLVIIFHLILPTAVAYYCFGEDFMTSFFVVFIFRHCFTLHVIWSLNSVTHIFGYKPYNKNIKATQNAVVAVLTIGEGWHNFHHTFPWDYRIAEFGQHLQVGARIIDLFAWLGLAYDLKSASPELIQKIKLKTNFEPGYIDEPYPSEELEVKDK